MPPKQGNAPHNAAKRKDPPPASGSKAPNSNPNRFPKRAKFLDARQIAAQGPDDVLKDGELDLQAFVAARAFEVEALEDSMRRTKDASSSRTFQRFPRGMRRRTASHNPKRVPKRLRAKAVREFRDDNTPLVVARRRRPTTSRGRLRAETANRLGVLAEKKRKRKKRAEKEKAKEEGAGDAMDVDGGAPVSDKVTLTTRAPRPKIRRNVLNEPGPVKSKFRRRQITKTWLPTHVWHAKRARMTDPKSPLWRFAIPLTPNEKIYRPTHRAQGESGTVVWDMSYMSTIGLYGNAAGIERVLKKLGIVHESCWNDKGRKWRAGTRSWTGMVSREASGSRPRRDICPATVLWGPEEPAQEGAVEQGRPKRQVFFRAQPSAFLELFNELLRLTKMENPRLYIEDLRYEIGSIDLTGPASTEALLGILTPYPQDGEAKEKHAELFTLLRGLTNPGALPANVVLGFSVQDPRLRYPPRTVPQPESQSDELLNTLATWPAEDGIKPFQLWSREARYTASRLPPKRAIDRRNTSKTPGAHLKATAVDPPIPVVLLAQRTGTGTQAQGTWTLLAPWKCIQPIWYSLVHYPLHSGGNPRFGGLNEVRQVAFERGLPSFPADFIGTAAGAEWEAEESVKRRARWDKRPKGKRTAWESVELGAGRKGEVGDGLRCDFEYLFSHMGDAEPANPPVSAESTETMEAAELPEPMEVDNPPEDDAADKQRQGGGGGSGPCVVTQLSKAQYNDLLRKSCASPDPPPRSVVQVRLSFITKGVATTCARIYRLPTKTASPPPPTDVVVPATDPAPPEPKTAGGLPANLRDQWLALVPNAKQTTKSARGRAHPPPPPRMPPDADLSTRKRLLAQSLVSTPLLPFPPPAPNTTDMGGHPLVPDAEDLIGFVTTGSFSLAVGRGTAVGCVAVGKVLGDLKGGVNAKEARLCVVRDAGEGVGRLARWEVI